jgi:hypothetical protein
MIVYDLIGQLIKDNFIMKKNVQDLILIFFFCGSHASSNNSEKTT